MMISSTHSVVMVLCAFIFGPWQPLMFWLALIYFLVMTTLDRLALAYSYKRPVMLDDSLNVSAINLMKLGPWIYLVVLINLFMNQKVYPKAGQSVYEAAEKSDQKLFDLDLTSPATPC